MRRGWVIRQGKATNARLKELQRKEDMDSLAKKDLEIRLLGALLSKAAKDIASVRESRARLVKLVRAVRA